MAYKMKGSPAKLGTIQGTSGHSSALKRVSSRDIKQSAREVQIAKDKEALAKIKETQRVRSEEAAKREEEKIKKETKSEAKKGGYVKGELFDVESDAYGDLSPEAQKYVTKKNKKVQAEMDKKTGEAKTESHFDIMKALGGFLSSGGGKEGLGAAFGAGFSKKSPNELLAMQKARDTRTRKREQKEGEEKMKNIKPAERIGPQQLKKIQIAEKLAKASNLGTNILDE